MKSESSVFGLKAAMVCLWVLMQLGCSTAPVRYPEQTQESQPSLPEKVTAGLTREEALAELEQIRSAPAGPYLLGQGDILQISVYDESDLSVDEIPIRPDGKISFPLVGDVEVDGFAVEEVRMALTKQLSSFLLDPKVSVLVRDYGSKQYTINGQVVNPGLYPLDSRLTLTQALARSGGLVQGQFKASSVELADLSHAFIARDGQMLPVDFVALFRGGDLSYDLPLRGGDYIYIPSGLSQEVYILGEVRSPDMFAFREGMALSKALVVAKGFTREADLSQIHVIRGSLTSPELYVVDLNEIYAGRIRDVALQPGDVVYVPMNGVSRWSDIVNKLLPSMVLARTGSSFL